MPCGCPAKLKIMIDIYGLPRTGTNYLEYLVRYNLCSYERNFVPKWQTYIFDYEISYYVSKKHSNPNLHDNNNVLIILKKYPNFLKSFHKWHGVGIRKRSEHEIFEMYKKAIADYLKYYEKNSENTIIILFEKLLHNEKQVLQRISEKFNILFNSDNIITSDNIISKESLPTKKKFEFVNNGDIEINEQYEQIKKLHLA